MNNSSKFVHKDVTLSRDFEDILEMKLSEQDALTLYGLYGDADAKGKITCSVEQSLWVRKVVDSEDKIYALYGVAHHYKNEGVPWVLCSEEAHNYPMQFARHTKHMLGEMLDSRPILVNWCLPPFFRFLKWLGFEITGLKHTSVYDPSLTYQFVIRTKTGVK